MSRRRFFNVVCIFLWASTANASFFSYASVGAASAGTPDFHYVTSKSNALLSGYSYETQDVNGASSVMFMTGPNSAKNFKIKAVENNKEVSMKMSESNMESKIMKKQEKMKPDVTTEKNMEPVEQQKLQPMLVQSSVFRKDSNLQFPFLPQFYILPSPLSTPFFTPSNFAQLRISSYPLKNPFIDFLNPTPYVPYVNALQAKAPVGSLKMTHESTKIRCGAKSQSSDTNPKNTMQIKVTPASEYVANAIERKEKMMNDINMENMSENPMDAAVETKMDISNNTVIENKNVTMLVQKDANEHMEDTKKA